MTNKRMRKKRIVYLLGMALCLFFVSCAQKYSGNAIRELKSRNEVIQSIAQYGLSRNIYNQYDADKNLLLQFVNNEIPLIENREKKIHILYFEELLKEYTSGTEASGYYILDITGDGKKDFCVVIQPLIFIFTYDENTKFFKLWAVERSQQIPLENRQMFSCDEHTQTIWTHYFMDQNGEMIYSISYQAEPYEYMESEGSWRVNYSITTEKQGEVTTEQVSQQVWTESIQELLNLVEQAPPLLQYDDLSILSKEEVYKDEQTLFEEFLGGERYAYSRGNADYKICLDDIRIPTGEPDNRYAVEYAYLDFDGDGQQELHVRSPRCYHVLICEDGELYLWYSRDAVLTPLQNRQFLSVHYGGAPTHEDYICYTLDMDGVETQSKYFSRYDSNGNGEYDEGDTYLAEGNEVTKKEWNTQMEALINEDGSISQDAVIDISWNGISEM